MSGREIKLKETVCFDLSTRLAVQNSANSAIVTPDIWSVFFIFGGEEFLPVILMSARPVKVNTACHK